MAIAAVQQAEIAVKYRHANVYSFRRIDVSQVRNRRTPVMHAFKFQAQTYPQQPGCYLMKDASGRILYVGKAKNLRNRLRSYFSGEPDRKRIRQLVSEIADIEVYLVNNEAESLMLENNLIKRHKPPYNRALKKDNSGYAYLRLTDERYPKFDVYYRNRKDSARHAEDGTSDRRFGPFASARFRNALIDFVIDHYKLRTCKTLPKRVCLLYHIGKCSGICEGKISHEAYMETVGQAADLLANRENELMDELRLRMERYADNLEFEKAHNVMMHIRTLEKTKSKQIVDRETVHNQDVLYFGEYEVMIASLQFGMVKELQLLRYEPGKDVDAACDRFIVDRYREVRPDEIIVSRLGDRIAVGRELRMRNKSKVELTLPKRGLKLQLLQLCRQNYEYRIGERHKMKEDLP
jgi:excinuclease ABC subunit C